MIDSLRLSFNLSGGSGRSFFHLRQFRQQAEELKLTEKFGYLMPFMLANLTVIKVKGNRHPGNNSSQFLTLAGNGFILSQRILKFGWGYFIYMSIYSVNGAKLLDKPDGSLFTNARNSGNVI